MRFKEFRLNEDEYSAAQARLGKNPNLRPVNAQTYNVTNPNTRYLNRMGEMTPEELATWKTRAQKLLARSQAIFAQLKSVMSPEDQPAVAGVKITVPLTGEMSWAAADFNDKTIAIDVGCFWDLSDDCLAYTIGHEMGHIVWAFGPKKMWPKQKGVKQTAQQNRQDELDADVYGARLALQLGYDRRKAWDHFTLAYQREPFDPAYPQYPSVGQRKANVEKDIKARASAAAQAQPAEPAPQTNPDKAEKDAWLGHIMQGLKKFETALANNPQLAQA